MKTYITVISAMWVVACSAQAQEPPATPVPVELRVQPLPVEAEPQYATPRDAAIAAFQAAWKDFHTNKDAKKALAAWSAASAKDTTYVPALYDLAVMADREGRAQDALLLYQKAAKGDDRKLADSALHELERVKLAAALEATPEGARQRMADMAIVNASALSAKSDAQKAINAWAEAAKAAPSRWEPPSQIGLILLDLHRYSDAIRYLEAAAKNASPKVAAPLGAAVERTKREVDWGSSSSRAKAEWDANDFAKAAVDYAAAYRIFPGREDSGIRWAGALLAADDLTQATTALAQLRDNGTVDLQTKAQQMLKDLASISPAAKIESERPPAYAPTTIQDHEEPIRSLIPPAVTEEMKVLARPLPDYVEDDTKPVLTSALPPSAGGPPLDGATTMPSGTAAEVTPAPPPAAPAVPVTVPGPTPPNKSGSKTGRGRAPTPSVVTVSSTPPGLQATFDNDQTMVCRTPCSLELPPGRHTVAISGPGYENALRILQVANEPLQVSVTPNPLRGVVSVTSDPAGIPVSINGAPSGQSTPVRLSLPVGQYNISLEIRGQRVEQVVDVKVGIMRTLHFE